MKPAARTLLPRIRRWGHSGGVPLSVWACSTVSEEARAFLGRMRHGRTTPSYSVDGTWVARDWIGINSVSALMMLRR